MSALNAFCTQLIRFFEDLIETFPEERDIKLALDTIQGARKINPRLILDMFNQHVTTDLREAIVAENEKELIRLARVKIVTQFNEILTALAIFDKHWTTLSEQNQQSIWKYLKVLLALSDKAKN
jgi:hypothetical protein